MFASEQTRLLLTGLQERVIYSKEVQTMAMDDDEVPHNIEEEIRQRIMREKDNMEAERVREKELEEESVKLDREIEQEIRGMLYESHGRVHGVTPSQN